MKGDRIGIWIKASERLPNEAGWKITRNIPSDLNSVSVLFFHNGEWLDDSNNGANNVKDGIFPTFEWLEEKENVYVFTFEELKKLIVDAVFEHKNTTIDKFLQSKFPTP